VPSFIGTKVLSSEAGEGEIPVTIDDLVEFIDWTPFFHSWELRGRYPSILRHEKYGEQATKLFKEAQDTLKEISARKLFRLKGIYGFFPAKRHGEDVVLYTDETRSTELTRFHFLRQQAEKDTGNAQFSLCDFVSDRPESPDYLGGFAVTSGLGLKEVVDELKAKHDDYAAIMYEAIGDRLAEAFAEFLHKRVREEWGFGKNEKLSKDELIAEKYQGIRPAAGYPACPDHTEKGILWDLMKVEEKTGISLTESYAMWPASSVSGLYFSHPDSKYFSVGLIGKDQVEDYAKRKGMSLEEAERWLGPCLSYQ